MSRGQRFIATWMGVVLLLGCGDDGNGNARSLSDIAQELASTVQAQVAGDQTQSAVKGLALSLVQALTNQGAPAPSVRGESALTVARSVILERSRWDIPATSEVLAQQIPRVPLGVTCVWSESANFWVGDADNPFGAVPQEAVRFALYDALLGVPTLPLNQIPGAFTDISPIQQAPQSGGAIRVALSAFEGSEERIQGEVTGTFTNGLVDAVMAGLIGAGENVVNFTAGLEETTGLSVLTTTATTSRLLVFASLTVANDGSGAVQVNIQDLGSNFLVQHMLTFSSQLVVTGGDVIVDAENAATITGGTLSSPQFAIDPEGPLGTGDLTDLSSSYFDAWTLNIHLIELLDIGLCIGTEDPLVCGLIPGLNG